MPTADPRANGWLAWPAGANPLLRLFCFPYAGGSGATIFRSWRNALPREIDVCAIQLPGRGARIREPHIRGMATLVPAVAEAIRPFCDRPFAFFGHSLGAVVAFETARHLHRAAGLDPQLLIASGHRAPQIPSTRRPIYDLPHDAFVAELRRLQGTPDEILQNQDLMELLLPTLRADFELSETYAFIAEPLLTIDVIAYGGADDKDDTVERLDAWRETTSGRFTRRLFPGGHFFIHTAESQLLATLSADLRRAVTTQG